MIGFDIDIVTAGIIFIGGILAGGYASWKAAENYFSKHPEELPKNVAVRHVDIKGV